MYPLSSIRQAQLFSTSALLQRFSSFNWVSQASSNGSGFLGCLKSFSAGAKFYENVGNPRTNLDQQSVNNNVSAIYASSFRSFRHLSYQRHFETGWDPKRQRGFEIARGSETMNLVRKVLEEDGKSIFGGSQFLRYKNFEQDADFVHIKLMRNNTFVTVTDSNGNKKCGASSGQLSELKGGAKVSRYAAEATAEHVGRLARNMGIKSVVVRVKGFTHFKKKRQAILSFREGFSDSRSDNPVVHIEDTTRRPHNGCRLPKKRRV
ncbi:PREDICTED: probable ribosomal protein S11, mitochondrial [Theobroma cacao]|uniref:Ribosomal L18p/L5e family protein, putative n=2 Tax=Theobroma cacao TaxID=3641 RepID=A0A061F4F0_THECC|nr:PREDICTED: probable ribosomal protein S11, mitochondrial [Theobroma cacao]EOY11562.1 Ribosomal L18p/L5e family protein, putative [Theobroma cacao]